MPIVNYNYLKTPQNTVILISFVENPQAHTDLKQHFIVWRTCWLLQKTMVYTLVGLQKKLLFS